MRSVKAYAVIKKENPVIRVEDVYDSKYIVLEKNETIIPVLISEIKPEK